MGFFEIAENYTILELILLGIVILWFSWVGANIPDFWQVAQYYWVLAISAIVLLPIVNMLIPEKLEKPLWKPKFIFVFLMGLAISVLVAILYSQTGYQAVSAPTFQIIPITGVEKALISGLAGIVENSFFFFVLPFFFCGIVLLLGRVLKIDLTFTFPVVFILSSIFGFSVWHTYRYGATNIPAMMSVVFFGVVNSIIVYVTKQLIVAHLWHFTNNFIITIYSYYAPMQVFWLIITNPVFIGLSLIMIIYLIRVGWKK
ncbi:MAG: hypothetical protein QXG39_00195 [Candidatus Aenigmatarchaeota archaeon]